MDLAQPSLSKLFSFISIDVFIYAHMFESIYIYMHILKLVNRYNSQLNRNVTVRDYMDCLAAVKLFLCTLICFIFLDLSYLLKRS